MLHIKSNIIEPIDMNLLFPPPSRSHRHSLSEQAVAYGAGADVEEFAQGSKGLALKVEGFRLVLLGLVETALTRRESARTPDSMNGCP